MIVAVTGGTGFIGRRLINRLAGRGDIVRVISRRSAMAHAQPYLELRQCDLVTASVGELKEILQGVDVLFNCAGQLVDEDTMKSLHVDATQKLIEAASGRIGHWVQLSSVGVYGQKRTGVIDENSALAPLGMYETTKAESDRLVLATLERGDFSSTILRPSNVFGVGMTNRSLYSLIGMIEKGWFFFIGERGASANYVHVDNVVDALLLCATNANAAGMTYNLSDRRSLEQFINIIATALGRNKPFLRLPEWSVRMLVKATELVPGFPLNSGRVDAMTVRAIYSTAKIERDIGYLHRVSMEDGLGELVDDWLKENGRIVQKSHL